MRIILIVVFLSKVATVRLLQAVIKEKKVSIKIISIIFSLRVIVTQIELNKNGISDNYKDQIEASSNFETLPIKSIDAK